MTSAQPSIRYTLSMNHPETHLFEVEMHVDGMISQTVDLHMPAWRTGRYVIFDFSGGVQEFCACDEKGDTLPFKKINKDTWHVEKGKAKSIVATYKVYANEFNQRTRELNDEHAFLDPAAVFMYVDELKTLPLELNVIPHDQWHVTTGLDEVEEKKFTFASPNFEHFIDCPLEIGNQKDFQFTVDGKQHILSIYGNGNWNADTLITDLTKIIMANKEFWGELPYKKYIFQIHCQPNAGGGTEHINSTIIGIRPFVFVNKESYKNFLGLISHEYFHTWNVKQLRPKAFAPYDLSKENYTEELWISEGTTSYFDELLLVDAGLLPSKEFVDKIPQMINNDRSRHGNSIQPLSESSFDAWVKFWRGKQNALNAQSDYYGKGAAVSLLLDLEIRHRSQNKSSLQSVMKAMFHRYPMTKGFTNADFQHVCEEFTEGSLTEFFRDYLYGTASLPWERVLDYAGFTVTVKDSTKKIGLGIALQDVNDKVRITNVTPNSPGEKAGLDINDEIVALNGYRARSSEINDRISELKAGDDMTFTVFRNDKLMERRVKLEYFGTAAYAVQKKVNPTALQRAIYEGWLKEKF
ncbi:MAG: PDZ domain-containing protein [Bacteroidota bacterium]|nr:PDZ domain-containing protein [Bacteroidota bacterium]